MNPVRAVIVVHDAACGDCADIARRLRDVLRAPVLARSCRDPALAQQYPELRGLGCRASATGVQRADGSVRWWVGAGAVLGLLGVVRPTRLPVAAAVLTAFARVRVLSAKGSSRGSPSRG